MIGSRRSPVDAAVFLTPRPLQGNKQESSLAGGCAAPASDEKSGGVMQIQRAVDAFVDVARHDRTSDAATILRDTLRLHAIRRVTPEVFEDDEQYLQVVFASTDDQLAR
jgi:hypothetical protein